MERKFVYANSSKFLEINSLKRVFAISTIALATFALTFLVFPFSEWKLHFYQAGIFASAFMFGPFAGAAVGIISSSYNALFVLHNPWLIAGNALLGVGAGYFYHKFGAYKAALAAFAIQIPYLVATDVYLMHMPFNVVVGIVLTLAVSNAICVIAANWLTSRLSLRL